jgi:endonuclease YncB( thermonuclease family)
LTAPVPAYVFDALFHRAVDGDTYELVLRTGKFAGTEVRAVVTVRLRGANTPERNQPGWAEARTHAESLLANSVLTVRTYKGSFARTVADVWCSDQPLADLLIAAGHAAVDERG